MKTKEFKELRSKDVKNLNKMAYDLRLKIMQKNMDVKSGREKNLKSVSNLRNELAKILTLVREKQIIESLNLDSNRKETTQRSQK